VDVKLEVLVMTVADVDRVCDVTLAARVPDNVSALVA
jgi:hypothetical protein